VIFPHSAVGTRILPKRDLNYGSRSGRLEETAGMIVDDALARLVAEQDDFQKAEDVYRWKKHYRFRIR
jgi:hypothetical protein